MSEFLVNNPKKILTLLAALTIYFGYYAYMSEDKLIVDFSLEQMFPENDIERDRYDQFRKEFSREDDKFLLVYSCDNPLSRENIKRLEDVTDDRHPQHHCVPKIRASLRLAKQDDRGDKSEYRAQEHGQIFDGVRRERHHKSRERGKLLAHGGKHPGERRDDLRFH